MLLSELPFPRFITAHRGLLSNTEIAILSHAEQIEAWFQRCWQATPALITSSVDLRHAGFKIAPVDTNLFPAGFNNLHPSSLALCAHALHAVLTKHVSGCRRVLLLPESHTRNTFYLQSLSILHDCLANAGFSVRIGSLDETQTTPLTLQTEQGRTLTIEPLVRVGDRIGVADFDPCLLLLNHDLSTGIPSILEGLSQPIYPDSQLGWGSRLKSSHFLFFNQVADEFSQLIGIDSWFINPVFCAVDGVDFMQQQGLDTLAAVVDDVLARVRMRYQAHGITQKPFVVVKADNGTYGMSVMMVHDGAELLALNRKQRTRMSARKGGQKVTHILIQEGVYSLETTANQSVAEPVVYMIGSFVVGNFYRVHGARGSSENLNTPGMYFETSAFEEPAYVNYGSKMSLDVSNRSYVYGVVARLAALAAARESAAIGQNLRKPR